MQSVINRSAVKEYALKVSEAKRAGKFTRVSEDFLVQVEAQVEAAIREVFNPSQGVKEDEVPSDGREFITGAALEKIRVKLNERAQAIVAGRVRRHPTIGQTLKD